MNIPNYPPIETVLQEIWKQPQYITLDADAMAKELGSVETANMVILGAASPYLDLKIENLEKPFTKYLVIKGEDVVELNIKAFQGGKGLRHQGKLGCGVVTFHFGVIERVLRFSLICGYP